MTEKNIPWWRLHKIAEELDGELKHLTISDSSGRKYKRLVIEYTEEENDPKINSSNLF